jgi:hypothetical protein
VVFPKVLLVRVADGGLRLVWFRALAPSIRNLRLKRSVTRKFFVRAMSNTRESRAAESVSSKAAVRTQGWHGKLRDRKDAGGEQLRPAESRCLYRREGTIRAVARVTVGIIITVGIGPAAGHAERQAIIEDSVTGDLPSAGSLAVPGAASGQEGKVPVGVKAETLRHIKLATDQSRRRLFTSEKDVTPCSSSDSSSTLLYV